MRTQLTMLLVTYRLLDWNQLAENWPHLIGINFPKAAKQHTVQILIGLEYADLHYAIHEINGKQGEYIARLTPLV